MDQLACLEASMRDEDIVMTLPKSLPASYKYLIVAFELIPVKKRTMDYMTARLRHEMSKRREKESQGEDATIVLQQSKGDNSFMRQGARLCFYCGKPGHIVRLFYKAKNKECENAKNAKDNDDYVFVMRNGAFFKSMCKWIINTGATKHVTSQRAAFFIYIYKVIVPCDVHLGDDSVVKAIKI